MKLKFTIKNNTKLESINFLNAAKITCERWASETVNSVKLSISGGRLKVKTGRLRNDIKYKVKQTKGRIKIEIGSSKVPYAKIHDDKKTTTIFPKTKRFLTVPVNESVKGRARQYSNTFVLRSKKGNLLVVQKVGKGKKARIKPLFILRDSVKITGTGYLTDNINIRKPILITALQLNLNNIKAQ